MEEIFVSGGEVGRRGFIGNRREDVGFGKSEFDAQRATKFGEGFEKKGKIGKGESYGGVIDDGSCV